MTDLQMQYLRGQVVDREATIERQAALLKQCKEALEHHTEQSFPLNKTVAALAAIEQYEKGTE